MATLSFTYRGYAHRLTMADGRSCARGGQIELTRDEAERLTKAGHRFVVNVTAEAIATEPPATDPPATDPPATDPPATDPPATNEGTPKGRGTKKDA